MLLLANASPGFSPVDWSIVAVYLLAMVAVGAWCSRRQKSTNDFFLSGGRVPAWAAAVSVVATSVSAATFIGAPEQSYGGNLTYLAGVLSSVVAVIIVAVWFIPAFYRERVTTIYELLERRLGTSARRSCSGAFMIGRLFASGARLYIAAIPVSLIAFGDLTTGHLIASILICSAVSILYTVLGGLDAVIWTEVPQAFLFVFAAVAAIALLLWKIPVSTGEVWTALATTALPDGSNKLTVLDWRWDITTDFSVWSAFIGLTLFNLAVYGTDHDLAQRMLTCKSALKGSQSALISNVLGLIVAGLFLVIGLLLYVFYQRADLMGGETGGVPPEGRKVFLSFILQHTPTGVKGLMLAGLFAAAMSSLASSMQAMSSTLVCDFYRPMRPGRDDAHYLKVSRVASLGWGVLLAGFGVLCIWLQESSGKGLIPFAMEVMLYAYTGMLGVFLTALFTRRGTSRSALLALVVGAAIVVLLQVGPGLMDAWWEVQVPVVSLGWKMFFGSVAAFAVAARPPARPEQPK
ncbi:MAG: sodium:solute symporter family transporter [Phycisphaerales bacterium]